IHDYDPVWPERLREYAGPLREAQRRAPSRIDHIGSPSVPGLAPKGVLDLQAPGVDLDAVEPSRQALEARAAGGRPHHDARRTRSAAQAAGDPTASGTCGEAQYEQRRASLGISLRHSEHFLVVGTSGPRRSDVRRLIGVTTRK